MLLPIIKTIILVFGCHQHTLEPTADPRYGDAITYPLNQRTIVASFGCAEEGSLPR